MRSLWSSIILLVTLLHAFRRSLAAHIDFPRRSATPLPNLFARAGNGSAGLNFFNNGYYINITLGGQQFSVLIDTGRWVGSRSVRPPLPSPAACSSYRIHTPFPLPTLAPTYGSRGQSLMPSTQALLQGSNTPWAQMQVCVPSATPRATS